MNKFDVSKLKAGQHIRIDIPIKGLVGPEETAGQYGVVGAHGHEKYPNLIVWFRDGSWIDLVDLNEDDVTVVANSYWELYNDLTDRDLLGIFHESLMGYAFIDVIADHVSDNFGKEDHPEDNGQLHLLREALRLVGERINASNNA